MENFQNKILKLFFFLISYFLNVCAAENVSRLVTYTVGTFGLSIVIFLEKIKFFVLSFFSYLSEMCVLNLNKFCLENTRNL